MCMCSNIFYDFYYIYDFITISAKLNCNKIIISSSLEGFEPPLNG